MREKKGIKNEIVEEGIVEEEAGEQEGERKRERDKGKIFVNREK